MLLSKLVENIDVEVVGNDVEVLGIENDNRKVKPGFAFFCIVGYVTDGHKFADGAINLGASVLFVEHKLDLDITQVVCKNTREIMGLVSAKFYDYPSERMNVVGVTGTNGKTTITHILQHVLGNSCVIGTNGIEVNGEKIDYNGRTTPESFQLQKLFSELNVDNVLMEVSSHALCLDRVTGTKFKVTAFVNLTQDHLDYHKTMQDYFEAKATLFSKKYPAKRVICIDDKWGQELARRCPDAITVGFNKEADYNPGNVKVDFPLIGKFNIQNMLVAYGICKALGVKNIEEKLASTPYVEGRMQKVGNCVVDYAHTPDALEKAINTLKEITKGRVITVFGCGGDRDKEKRPKMGKIASEYSDYTIVTSDNPRSEDPQEIINQIVEPMNNYKVVIDRREAIAKAINMANKEDMILVAGKGHEKTQTIGDKVIPFDDVEVIKSEI